MSGKSGIKIKLSHSHINTFDTCRRKYYYNYKKRLPQLPWPHLLKGNFTHDVLEQWVKNGIMKENCPRTAMKKAYRGVRDSGTYNGKSSDTFAETKEWLRGAIRDFEKVPFVPLEAEAFISFRYRGIEVRGKVDRIDQVDPRTVEIIDYKTSKSEKWLSSSQLGIYRIAAQFGSLSPKYGQCDVKASFVLLRYEMKKVSYNLDEEGGPDVVLNNIEKAADAILTETRWDPEPSHLCKTCDFFIQCQEDTGNGGSW